MGSLITPAIDPVNSRFLQFPFENLSKYPAINPLKTSSSTIAVATATPITSTLTIGIRN